MTKPRYTKIWKMQIIDGTWTPIKSEICVIYRPEYVRRMRHRTVLDFMLIEPGGAEFHRAVSMERK